MFVAALFTIAQKYRQLKYALVDEYKYCMVLQKKSEQVLKFAVCMLSMGDCMVDIQTTTAH